MGSSYGVGQGFQQGVSSLMPIASSIMEMKQQDKLFDKQLKAQEAWARGMAQAGLPFGNDPSTGMPAIPATEQMAEPSQVGRLEVPGQALAMPKQPTAPQAAPPRPAPAAMPATGASALAFPSSIRTPQVFGSRSQRNVYTDWVDKPNIPFKPTNYK